VIVAPTEQEVAELTGATTAPATQFIASQEPPAEWVRRLREISPISDVVSWLDLKWHAPAQRWVLYECVPIRYVSDNELIADLGGPDPDSPEGERLFITVSRYQQEMFRKHRVHARPCWVIQGEKGGTQVVFSESTKELCRARQLPTEPPAAGSQPYAPFDERVVTQLLRLSKLTRVRGDLAEFKRRFGNPSAWRREKRNELQAARAEMVRFLNDQLDIGDDLIQSGVRKGEVDDLPTTDSDFVKENEDWDRRYVEKGL
jgi:hypothetical protein